MDEQATNAALSTTPEAALNAHLAEINKVNTSNVLVNKRANNDEEAAVQLATKKRKKCDAHEGAVPFRSSMIQLDDVKKLDQRLIAEGFLHALPYTPSSSSSFTTSSASVHLDLISNDPDTGLAHRLPILLQGAWALSLVKDISLSPDKGKRVRLAFKEGKLVKDASGPENNQLVFSRGCEVWVCKAGEAVGETWKRYRRFAAAQNEVKQEVTDKEATPRSPLRQPQEERTTSTSPRPAPAPASSASERQRIMSDTTETNEGTTSALRIESASGPLDDAQQQIPFTQVDTLASSAVVPAVSAIQSHRYSTISDVRKASTGTPVSVIGLALDSNENKMTSHNHYSSSFKIVDPSCLSREEGGYGEGEGMTVTFMHPRQECVPSNVQAGDVVLIRGIKVQHFRGKAKITAFAQDTACVWAVAKASAPTGQANSSSGTMFLSPNFKADILSPEEYADARQLHTWNVQRLQNHNITIHSDFTSSSHNNTIQGVLDSHAGSSTVQYCQPIRQVSRYMRLNELEPIVPLKEKETSRVLFDCMVAIVAPPKPVGPFLEIYVSDYSTHSRLRPHPEADYYDISSGAARALFVISFHMSDFASRLEHIKRDLGEVGNIVEITGLKVRPYGGFWEGKVDAKRREFGWRIIKENEEDLRKTQLLEAKKAFFALEQQDLGARFAEEEKEKDNSFADSGYDSVSAGDGNDIPFPKQPTAGLSTTKASGPIKKLSRTRKTLNLSELTIPKDPPDASCFFDCYCEIVEDVYDAYSSPVRLFVTDYNPNRLLFDNTQHSAYPSDRIIFSISFWDCPTKVDKIKHLKEGDRVFIENIRVKKSNSYKIVEGNIGSKGEFRVTVLDKEHPEWHVLQKPREKQASTVSAEEKKDSGAKPQKAQADYVKCKRQAEPVASYNDIINNKESAQYRLRGRVVAVDRSLDEILVNHCNKCQHFLKYGSTTCEQCPPEIASGFTPTRWRFGLSIELEPPGRDISKDATNNDMTVWVHVDERDPDLAFMNGLQPTQANLPIAQALLKKLTDNPSEDNDTNPIFDFCAWSFPKQGVLLMIKTALVREGQGLPWSA